LRAHSPARYKNDESISSLQKSIRRGERQRALFFAVQIILAGYPQYLLTTLLPTIVCEDVCTGWIWAPIFILKQIDLWQALRKTKKLSVKQAALDPECSRIILDAVAVLCDVPKLRLAACASGAMLADQTPLERPEGCGTSIAQIRQLLTDAIILNKEKEVVRLAHWMNLILIHADPKETEKTWRALFQTFAVNKSIIRWAIPIVQALWTLYTNMASDKNMGAPRLPWFEAIFVAIGKGDPNYTKNPVADKVDVNLAIKMLTTPNQLATRFLNVEPWATDKHTERGRGIDTTSRLLGSCKALGGEDIIKTWSKAEISKSHGIGLKPIGETQLERFWDEGVQIKNAAGPNPYHDACRTWYLQQEAKQGSKKARSRYGVIDYWKEVAAPCLVKEWDLTFPEYKSSAQIKKEKKENKVKGKAEKKSKSGKDEKKESASKGKKRKPEIDVENDEPGSAEDGKPLAKRQKTEAKRKSKPSDVKLDSGIKLEPLLNAIEDKIITYPMAQILCGVAKKPTRLGETSVWKGPYDSTKEPQVTKLNLTFHRTIIFQIFGVATPTVVFFQSERTPTHIWLSFQDLKTRKSHNWEVDSEIVKRSSTGLELLSNVSDTILLQPIIVRDALLALASRAIVEPPCGDSHFNNLLVIEGKQVWNVDIEETRGSFPDNSTNIWDWLCSRPPAAARQLLINKVIDRERVMIRKAFEDWELRVRGISPDNYSVSRLTTIMTLLHSMCPI